MDKDFDFDTYLFISPNKIIISSFSEDILKQSIHNLPNF